MWAEPKDGLGMLKMSENVQLRRQNGEREREREIGAFRDDLDDLQTEDDFFRVNSEMLNTQANMG